MSRLDLVVGPNGAGKSTFVHVVLHPTWPRSVFVNADVIAADQWPADPAAHSYEAARLASDTRSAVIARGLPLIAETVFSHPSKLELIDEARSAEYFVALHVIMIPVDLAVARVAARVIAGGHEVPEDKIRHRHARLWPNVIAAVATADTATFWDNSRADGPELVALFGGGYLLGSPGWPSWAPEVLVEAF